MSQRATGRADGSRLASGDGLRLMPSRLRGKTHSLLRGDRSSAPQRADGTAAEGEMGNVMRIELRRRSGLRMPPSRPIANLAAGLLTPSRRFSWAFLVAVAACAALLMLWQDGRHLSFGLNDLYPLYYGGKAWLASGNAYRLGDVAPIQDQQHGIFLTGNAYPLLAVLIVLPLALLTPHAASVVWVGLITAGLLVVLRLHGSSCWLILYWPLLESIRLEQFTSFVVLAQILALWAFRTRRPWLLGVACALVLTKPTQGALFVLALLLLTSDRLRPVTAIAAIWGGTLLLDRSWPQEWLVGLAQYNKVAQHPYYWQLALLALPCFLLRHRIGAAIVASFALFRFPLPAPYMASMLPLALLDDRRVIWLVPASYLWWPLAATFGHAWGVALAFFFPVLALAALRWYEQRLVWQGTVMVAATPERAASAVR